MNYLLLNISIASVLFSCRSTATSTTEATAAGITYLALGDSYTIGESVASDERYPNQLMEALKNEMHGKLKKSTGITEIVARTGWTTSELQSGIKAAGITGKKYDLVSLLIGVNNEFRGMSIEAYKTEFVLLLNQAITFANGRKERVFVISIPDYGYTPYGKRDQPAISIRIDEFNAVNKAIADSMQVTYFDITPISRKALADPSLVADDGLHPSGKMYKKWVKLMVKDVVRMVRN